MSKVRYIAWACVVVLLLAVGYVTLKRQGGERGTGEASIGGHFELVDMNNKVVTDQEFNGLYRLIFFGFSNCPDVCPTGLMNITNVLKKLGADATNLVPLFITVDPERDTPEQLLEYSQDFDPRIRYLTGTKEQIQAATDAFKVYYNRVPKPEGEAEDGTYMIDHSAYIYLLDKDGKYLAHFTQEQDSAEIAEEIRKLIKEK